MKEFEGKIRIQAYAAASLVNFFQSSYDTTSYVEMLPIVFGNMVRLLHDGTNFVKENALQAVAVLAISMEEGGFDEVSPVLFSFDRRGSDGERGS